jgi:hypothetical protein
MKFSVSIESFLILLICVTDMATTLYWVSCGLALEANPIMARLLQYGVAAFVFIKLLSFIPYILVSEWYKTHNPVFVRKASRAAIAAYLFTYALLSYKVNLG